MVLYTEHVAARGASPRWVSPDTPSPDKGRVTGMELSDRIPRMN